MLLLERQLPTAGFGVDLTLIGIKQDCHAGTIWFLGYCSLQNIVRVFPIVDVNLMYDQSETGLSNVLK